jgi:hypothetical protein
MAEPTTTSSAGIIAFGSGMAGAMLLSLGISWALLIWAALGCIVGVTWAPETGRIRAISLFSSAAMLSAKGGAIASTIWFAGPSETAQGIAAGLGILFHPLLSIIVSELPKLVAKRLA